MAKTAFPRDNLMQRATALHQQGRLDEARTIYRQVLTALPRDVGALHLMALALGAQRAHVEALAHFRRALAVEPRAGVVWSNQAILLRDMRRPAEALASAERAIALQPGFADAHNNRGNALKDLDRLEEALASYDRALALQPGHPEAHYNRGHVLLKLERPEEALAALDRALALRDHHAEAHNNRGMALRALNRTDAALAAYERALALAPRNADIHNNRGNVLRELGRLDAALASYEQALALNTADADAHYNRANVLKDLERLDEAAVEYGRVVTLLPDSADAFNDHAVTLKRLRRFDEAIASYDRAVALNPEFADAWWNKSLLLLLRGDYLEGWRLYEWRLKRKGADREYYHFPQLAWRGAEDLRGRRLLIHAEQGLGDVVQFSRYAALAHAAGAEVILEVQPPLLELMTSLDTPTTLVTSGQHFPEFDAYCPVMSLPHAFRTTVDTVPAQIPYLHADPERVRAWQARLGARTRPRVGLVWSGSSQHKDDVRRSMRLADLLPLLDPGIAWHALHKEYREVDRPALDAHPEIRQHQDELGDFADTAALIECLDLVISVDTSVVHVAGALGKPVWVMLAFAPDYRWLLDRADSPWYPTARLFRQPRADDWASVVGDLSGALRAWSAQLPERL